MPEPTPFAQTLARMPELGSKVHLPDPGLTLKPIWHPQNDAIEARLAVDDRPYVLAHFRSEKATAAYLGQRVPAYGGLCYPHAKADRIYSVMRMMNAGTLMDDAFTPLELSADQRPRDELLRHYLDALEGILPPASAPLPRLLFDTLPPIQAQLAQKPRVWERMKAGIRSQLVRMADPLAYQMDTLTLDGYMDLRRDNAFGEYLTMLTEYALDVDMTDALAEDASLRAVRTAAMDAVILVNDFFSFRKEVPARDSLNAMWVLMREEGRDLQQAVYRLAALCARNEQALIRSRDAVLAGPLGQRPDVRAYVRELEYISSGNAEWCVITRRYHLSDQRFVSGEVTIAAAPTLDDIAAADARAA